MKKILKRLLKVTGLKVLRENIENSNEALIKHYLEYYKIDLIIDAGANIGQYGTLLREAGYKNQIISFEPLKTAFKALAAKSARDAGWETHNLGVGSSNQVLEINVSKNSVSSSILQVTNNSTEVEPLSGFSGKETIEVVTIESFLGDRLSGFKNIYLKVDVQGYELEVLKGCGEWLSRIKMIELEMSFLPLYEQGPIFKDLLSWMESMGFELFTIAPDFRDWTTGRLMQADGVFINSRLKGV